MSEIVVGLDTAAASHAALAWAAEQARMTGVQLRAVHTLTATLPVAASVGTTSVPRTLPAEKVDKAYREAVTAVWESVQPEADWELEFRQGEPGRVLVAQSAEARMLVIGTREHVGWARILSGSVSHYCLSHASCPVVAVPPVVVSVPEAELQAPADEVPAGE